MEHKKNERVIFGKTNPILEDNRVSSPRPDGALLHGWYPDQLAASSLLAWHQLRPYGLSTRDRATPVVMRSNIAPRAPSERPWHRPGERFPHALRNELHALVRLMTRY